MDKREKDARKMLDEIDYIKRNYDLNLTDEEYKVLSELHSILMKRVKS